MNDAAPALSPSDRQTLIRDALAAAQRGQWAEARGLAERATAGADEPDPWLLLAQICRAEGDHGGEETAVDALLKRHPRQLQALLMKGDGRARAGDTRAACSFYQLALGVAANASGVPQSLLPDLERAERFLADASRTHEAHLREALEKAGIDATRAGNRFGQAIDLLCGRSQLYLQQPSAFYFPGLPQVQFYERGDFPWVPALEAAAPTIRAELEAVLTEGGDRFTPYVEATPQRPRSSSPLFDDPSWGALHLWRNGEVVPEASTCFPRTIEALSVAPLPFIAGRSPMALFSRLRPGTHIPAHHGLLNTRLICHLPLVVPPGCRFRVGNETRNWIEGEMLIFDDSIEHEAWNDSTETRVVLLFEIWRPELSAEERVALTALFQSIDIYDSGAE